MATHPLQSTGPISFNDIRIELGIPSKAPFNIEDAENENVGAGYPILQRCVAPRPSSSNPASISEWYGYNHASTGSLFVVNSDRSTVSCADACTSTPGLSCVVPVYQYSSTYYLQEYCMNVSDGYYAVCSGGSKIGQTCYYINNGTLSSTDTCTTTTTTTTTSTTTAAPVCTCLGNNTCSDECPFPGSSCTTVDDCLV